MTPVPPSKLAIDPNPAGPLQPRRTARNGLCSVLPPVRLQRPGVPVNSQIVGRRPKTARGAQNPAEIPPLLEISPRSEYDTVCHAQTACRTSDTFDPRNRRRRDHQRAVTKRQRGGSGIGRTLGVPAASSGKAPRRPHRLVANTGRHVRPRATHSARSATVDASRPPDSDSPSLPRPHRTTPVARRGRTLPFRSISGRVRPRREQTPGIASLR